MSTFDHWIASKFRNCCQKSPIMRAQVASLCCRWGAEGWAWRLYDIKLHSKQYPLESPEIFCRRHGIVDYHWFALIDTDQLPRAYACILDPETLASGILLCTHILLQSAMTDRIMRFASNKQQNLRLLPWIWRKRTHRHVERSLSREIIHIAPHLSFPWKKEEYWIHTISSVLEALPRLLSYRPAQSRVMTALKLVLSLRSTQARHKSGLHNAKHAIIQYLSQCS